MYKYRIWIAAAGLLVVTAHAEPLHGGGRVADVDVAARILTVDTTPLRLDARSHVFDYAGKPVSISALEVGVSVSYTAVSAEEPGEFPLVRDLRMAPN